MEFTTDDGLNSDLIVNLIQIRGHVYVGTFKGIDIVSLTMNNDQAHLIRKFKSFTNSTPKKHHREVNPLNKINMDVLTRQHWQIAPTT